MHALAIDTSTHRAGVALWQDGCCLAHQQNDDPSLHAERLIAMIDRALAIAGLARSDVDLVVSCLGPGSFTGVRVGLSTAKGIALGLDRPLVGIGSLEAMAAGLQSSAHEVIVPLLDARKGEIFWAAYARGGETINAPAHTAATEIEHVLATLGTRKLVVVGEIAARLHLGGAEIWRSEMTDLPHAAQIARLGAEKFERFGPADMDALEPVYVRPPEITQPKPR